MTRSKHRAIERGDLVIVKRAFDTRTGIYIGVEPTDLDYPCAWQHVFYDCGELIMVYGEYVVLTEDLVYIVASRYRDAV